MSFIDGVSLIEEIKIQTETAIFIGTVVEMIGLIVIIMAYGACVANTQHKHKILKKITTVTLIILGCSMIFAGTVFAKDITSFETIKNKFDLIKSTGQYKVSVTDDIDMNEFYKKYEIISYENDVFVIKQNRAWMNDTSSVTKNSLNSTTAAAAATYSNPCIYTNNTERKPKNV